MATLVTLTAQNHDRDVAGYTYVYPVYSRRARGLSIGINLNPNNACNWRCIYCQVPNLVRGSAPPINLLQLEKELRALVHEVSQPGFLEQKLPSGSQRINDIAISGNGEPTSAKEFADVITLIAKVMADSQLLGKIKLVLITNGSLIHRATVKKGLQRMAEINGEVWFKLDSATKNGMRKINNSALSIAKVYANLRTSAMLCPTWLQTCVFETEVGLPVKEERAAYLSFIDRALSEKIALKGVHIYGLARPSLQPEAAALRAASASWLSQLAQAIEGRGLAVTVSD